MIDTPSDSLTIFGRYQLVTRRRIDLLSAMIDVFKDDAILSLVGNLSQIDFQSIPGANVEAGLHLTTSVSIALRPDTKTIIQQRLLPRVGLRKRVWQVQITKGNIIVFAADDGFAADCVWVIATISEHFLQSLILSKCIWTFQKID
jgi:hypothetical protein